MRTLTEQQMIDIIWGATLMGGGGGGSISSGTVSYTHLDVYKRQVIVRSSNEGGLL